MGNFLTWEQMKRTHTTVLKEFGQIMSNRKQWQELYFFNDIITCISWSKDNLLDGLLEGFFHLLGPQWICKWSHSGNRSIQNRCSFVQGCLFFCWRVGIHEYTASIRDGNDNNVRGACRKSLFSLTGRRQSQNCLDDEHVG